MPRFYFHVRDDKDYPDCEGMLLQDSHVALREAITFAGRVIAEEAQTLCSGNDWHLDVCDEDGLVLFRLDFDVTPASEPRETAEA